MVLLNIFLQINWVSFIVEDFFIIILIFFCINNIVNFNLFLSKLFYFFLFIILYTTILILFNLEFFIGFFLLIELGILGFIYIYIFNINIFYDYSLCIYKYTYIFILLIFLYFSTINTNVYLYSFYKNLYNLVGINYFNDLFIFNIFFFKNYIVSLIFIFIIMILGTIFIVLLGSIFSKNINYLDLNMLNFNIFFKNNLFLKDKGTFISSISYKKISFYKNK